MTALPTPHPRPLGSGGHEVAGPRPGRRLALEAHAPQARVSSANRRPLRAADTRAPARQQTQRQTIWDYRTPNFSHHHPRTPHHPAPPPSPAENPLRISPPPQQHRPPNTVTTCGGHHAPARTPNHHKGSVRQPRPTFTTHLLADHAQIHVLHPEISEAVSSPPRAASKPPNPPHTQTEYTTTNRQTSPHTELHSTTVTPLNERTQLPPRRTEAALLPTGHQRPLPTQKHELPNTLTHGNFHPSPATRQTTTFPPSTPPKLTPPDGPHPAITPTSEPKIRSRRTRPNSPRSASQTLTLGSLTSDRPSDVSQSRTQRSRASRCNQDERAIHENDPTSELRTTTTKFDQQRSKRGASRST